MLHLQTPPSSVKEGKQKCEPVLKGQGHEDIAVLVQFCALVITYCLTINTPITI